MHATLFEVWLHTSCMLHSLRSVYIPHSCTHFEVWLHTSLLKAHFRTNCHIFHKVTHSGFLIIWYTPHLILRLQQISASFGHIAADMWQMSSIWSHDHMKGVVLWSPKPDSSITVKLLQLRKILNLGLFSMWSCCICTLQIQCRVSL